MSLELCILASGSGGNSTVLRTPGGGVVLIDAGIGPRTTAKRMNGSGVSVADVRAICLTHLDRDHFTATWLDTIRKLNIRVYCHRNRREELLAYAAEFGKELQVETFNGRAFEPIGGVKFRSLRFEHDDHGSHGFLIEGFGCRVGYATDLGQVPRALIDEFCGVDVLALESNYDPEMQMTSGRPWFLKKRIMGGRGHLSNPQAFAAIREILDRCERHPRGLPQHIVLLHRSRDCNCPRLVRSLFERDVRIRPRLTLGEQFSRSGWLAVRRDRQPLIGEQLSLPLA